MLETFDAENEQCGCAWMKPATWVMCAEHYAALEAELECEPRVLPALTAMLRRAAEVTG